MIELSIRTRYVTGYVRFGGSRGGRLVDWDEVERKKRETNANVDRQRELDEQRKTDFWREIAGFTASLSDKFAAEAEQFNARHAVPSDQIEISRGDGGIELRKLSPPAGVLRVAINRRRDSAELVCTTQGHRYDGRAETLTVQYSATWEGIGFVIRDASGRAVSDDAFVQAVMAPFAEYIVG